MRLLPRDRTQEGAQRAGVLREILWQAKEIWSRLRPRSSCVELSPNQFCGICASCDCDIALRSRSRPSPARLPHHPACTIQQFWLLEIAGVGSERVQTFVAVESPSLSAAPPGHPGFKRGLGDKRSPRSFCEDADAIGQTHDIDDASTRFGRGIVDCGSGAPPRTGLRTIAPYIILGRLDVDRRYFALPLTLSQQLDAHDVVADHFNPKSPVFFSASGLMSGATSGISANATISP